MSNQKRTLTPAAIKYLLAISELCSGGRGARSVDVAMRLNVSKPSTHHMIQALCEAGYAERERYGAIYLTDAGRSAAAASSWDRRLASRRTSAGARLMPLWSSFPTRCRSWKRRKSEKLPRGRGESSSPRGFFTRRLFPITQLCVMISP